MSALPPVTLLPKDQRYYMSGSYPGGMFGNKIEELSHLVIGTRPNQYDPNGQPDLITLPVKVMSAASQGSGVFTEQFGSPFDTFQRANMTVN